MMDCKIIFKKDHKTKTTTTKKSETPTKKRFSTLFTKKT